MWVVYGTLQGITIKNYYKISQQMFTNNEVFIYDTAVKSYWSFFAVDVKIRIIQKLMTRIS
jgi:hypothetical protein